MISFKNYITEKIMKQEGFSWLENPTDNQIVGWFNKSTYKHLRGLWEPEAKVLCIWDGYEYTHMDFSITILRAEKSDDIVKNFNYRVNIDPFHQDEGSFVGTDIPNNFRKTIGRAIQKIKNSRNDKLFH